MEIGCVFSPHLCFQCNTIVDPSCWDGCNRQVGVDVASSRAAVMVLLSDGLMVMVSMGKRASMVYHLLAKVLINFAIITKVLVLRRTRTGLALGEAKILTCVPHLRALLFMLRSLSLF